MRVVPNLISFVSGVMVAAASIPVFLWFSSRVTQVRLPSSLETYGASIYIGAGVAFVVLAFFSFPVNWARSWSTAKSSFEKRQDVSSASVALQKQFSQFLALISESVTNVERHGDALRLYDERLRNVPSDDILRTIICDLIKSNETYRRQSDELERRLREARSQAQQLQVRVRQAEIMASLDPLTGIANRRKFDDELRRLVALSHEEQTPLCLIMVDIDHFKAVNDTFGHRAGDAVLRQFSELLTASVRSTDLVARYGGEEFALILPKAPLGNGYEIAERGRDAVQKKSWINFDNCERLQLTASFGIADIRDGEQPIDLIKRADAKLYEAKANGRNRVAVWHSIE